MQFAQQHRETLRKLQEVLHAQDLAANEIRLERAALESRLRDDYGIELDLLAQQPIRDEIPERNQVEAEIAELRRKLTNIGGVNLDALVEIDEMEARYLTLTEQYQDLSKAKESLEQIITRINADSRRLFAETLETVKGHFQQLFRKLFGGGQADIMLEEDVDILESGIEIVARPPGKEPRSISLLSGGEKTLTCVALLLGHFPQPPQSVLRAGRSRCRVGRSQYRALHRRVEGISGLDAVHRRHAFQEDDDLRQHAVRRDDAGIGHFETRFRALRGRFRNRRNQPRGAGKNSKRRSRLRYKYRSGLSHAIVSIKPVESAPISVPRRLGRAVPQPSRAAVSRF